jgi:hypothetical protein
VRDKQRDDQADHRDEETHERGEEAAADEPPAL